MHIKFMIFKHSSFQDTAVKNKIEKEKVKQKTWSQKKNIILNELEME